MPEQQTITSDLEANSSPINKITQLLSARDIGSQDLTEIRLSADEMRFRAKFLRKLEMSGEILKAAEQGVIWVRIIRSALRPHATIEDKRLAVECMKFLRMESREEKQRPGGTDGALIAAMKALTPSVSVNVNVGSPEDERRLLEHRATNGLTAGARERAAAQLAKLDAAAGRQPSTTIDAKVSAPTQPTDDVIEAAAKVETSSK